MSSFRRFERLKRLGALYRGIQSVFDLEHIETDNSVPSDPITQSTSSDPGSLDHLSPQGSKPKKLSKSRKRSLRAGLESKTDDSVESLGIDSSLVTWLHESGISVLTRVQKLSIPKFLRTGLDLLVQSHTGSGKTLCFVIPMLDMFLKSGSTVTSQGLINVFSVIILPTRELATQVHSVVNSASSHVSIQCLVLIGGCSLDHDVKSIHRLKDGLRPIVIATPGRLRHMIDLLSQEKLWTFKEVCMLVLDEADRLLEMGYQTDMTTIIGTMPKQRKTGFFSATLPVEVLAFAKRILRNYEFINADAGAIDASDNGTVYATPRTLNNFYVMLDPREKLHFLLLLLHYLRHTGVRKCAVFFLTCDLVDYFFQVLGSSLGTDSGTVLYRIHRKMPTPRRQRQLDMFRSVDTTETRLQVMLCTDVFSRGIDIPEIEWVIQYDAPQDPNFYVHRIGRVSRAGAAGNAILLLNHSELPYVQFQLNRKIPLTPVSSSIIDWITSYYSIDSSAPYILDPGNTTVNNGESYIDYLLGTSPDIPVLPWDYTCKLLSFLRYAISIERSLMILASKAFVSYTRAYSEHRLKSIFEQRSVDYGGLATSFGVLRVPRVKEILGKALRHFVNSDIDPGKVAFLDPEKEKARLAQLELRKQVERPRVEKVKPAPIKQQRTRSEKRIAKRENVWREWDELAREEALIRKLKRGKINKEQYEHLLGAEEAVEQPGNIELVPQEESDWEKELDDFVNECNRRNRNHQR
ncbi:DEAD/DEAH box helicase family protein [Babesia bovis T2Bo]|uniref:ATP-dependent RNA helicase n=1 Tax=Babesia bovis TaxID=5865 RepID=A7ANF1_BABBO|nr:DEAD/DEAH box helicase family protein [Babesia bovis T2Bo]EDO08085.1 DEAD/DEAH box helicase family protein [Babesia bovis T2Bo]|eukprot:XP_001611653.1 DEAD/DEAH box domain containing protein [Babesia bovis T2Bo]